MSSRAFADQIQTQIYDLQGVLGAKDQCNYAK